MFTNRHRKPNAALQPLRELALFAGLSDTVLARIDASMVELRLDPGSVLTTEHEQGREAFIVADGVAEVRIAGRAVSSAAAGDLIGEMSLLDGGPRTATVVALTPMRVYVLDPRQFAELFSDPHSAQRIAANLSLRLRSIQAAASPLAAA
jgi:CRP/FNR family cyclic AMP-dependent transcriptional regulator